MEYAGIHLLDSPYFLDVAFDYYIPSALRGKVDVGDFVVVPFGNANKKRLGLAVSIKDKPERQDTVCKPICDVVPKKMSLSSEMLGLCFFMKEHTLCTVGDAVRSMVPASAISRLVEIWSATSAEIKEEFDESTLLVCEYIRKKGSVKFDLLKKHFGEEVLSSLKKLSAAGLVENECILEDTSEKTESYLSLAIEKSFAESIVSGNSSTKLRSAKHIEILSLLIENVEMSEADVRRATDASAAQIKALCDKALIKKEQRALKLEEPRAEKSTDVRPIILNDEQTAAYQKLCELSSTGEAHGVLLQGVTGSGKTSVMLKLIDNMIERGRGVIVLLPEIALTPQTLSIFRSRYGSRVAVVHSGLSVSQRYETYCKIKDGRADVVVGTRSAVFSPVHDLGAIIIDEEQEHTYKSDMSPKYHARDIARYRCHANDALMLLASATPSLESYKKATDGKYTLLKLTKRYGGATLPQTTIVDMRNEAAEGNTSPLGALLCQRLVEVVSKGEQAILFLNRRGYNNFLSCRDCGESVKCPRCSVSMTYHTFGESYSNGELRCHWCGARIPQPSVCPSCKGEHLARIGYGTQRIEEELKSLLPKARILRMDTDTTVSSASYEQMLTSFRRHEADILLGTQIVTKGHDFPDVTLVGVLLADSSLYLDDYRANEKTFSMLTQVIGRAGRSKKAGEAIIQTNNPNNDCIKLACLQDYDTFFAQAIGLRRALKFPPYCDIVLLTLTSSDEKELFRASDIMSKKLKDNCNGAYSDVPIELYGPFEAPVYKVENRYRMRMVAKCVLNKQSRALFSAVLREFSQANVRGLSLSIDFNPSNL